MANLTCKYDPSVPDVMFSMLANLVAQRSTVHHQEQNCVRECKLVNDNVYCHVDI